MTSCMASFCINLNGWSGNVPEQMIEKIKKRILPQWKMCFWWALIMGIIAHLYKITSWLPNWDSLVFRYDAQNMIALGRWFLPIVCAPSSFYDLPWIAGLIAIVFHALGSVCICKIFDVQKNATAILIGTLVATFPTVTSVMMYNYVADGYAIAFLFSCVAAMLAAKEKPNYIGSLIMITLSAGIYQAYITVTIMLLLCYLIMQVIYKESNIKSLLTKCVQFLFIGILGMALYYLVLVLLIKITGIELLEYQGLDSAASLSGIDIWSSLYVIKNSFTGYFFDFSKGPNVFNVINSLVFLSAVVLYVADIIKNKLSITKILFLIVCLVLLPVGSSVLAFINSSIDYHNLMKMGFCVFYLFFILQYERTEFKNIKLNMAKLWTILVITVVLIFNQVVIANVCYHHLQMAFEKSYGVLIRLADRIEQTPEAKDCDSILVIGALEESEAYSLDISPDMTGATEGFILRADDETVGQSVLCSALNDYCGKNYKFISGDKKAELLKKPEIANMNNWPAKDSIFVTDNIIVIKLGVER